MNHLEYEKIKAAEMAYAEARIKTIRDSKDPNVRYKDVRPIIDMKHMVMTSADIYHDHVAFYVKDVPGGPYRPIMYPEAKADMDAIGTALLELGLKDKRISVLGENRYEWAVSYLAVVCGTGVVVPLDKELPVNELENLLIEAESEAIIFPKKFEPIFRELRDKGTTKLRVLICMDEPAESDVLYLNDLKKRGNELLAQGNTEYLDVIIDRNAMSILLFTSGTTGISKGVMLSHANIVEDLMATPPLMNTRDTDIFFSVLPLHHTYECTCGFLVPFYRGSAIAYCEGLRHIMKNLQEARPTVFLGVPVMFENIYKKIWANAKKSGQEKTLKTLIKINRVTKKFGLNLIPKKITDVFGGRMRVMICGGAAINPEVLQGFKDFGINSLQGYGLTECAPMIGLNPDKGMRDDAAGYIPPGMQVTIMDADPETGIGEICAKGDNIMLGYYRNPEATAEVIIDGWFHTGDLGYIKDNFIYITGRKKNVIITKNGKNVFPEEIEYYLGNIPYVAESMVWDTESEDGSDTLIIASIYPDKEALDEALGAGWTKEAAETLLWQEVDKINADLPFFKRIKKIKIRDAEFVKNTSKKIKRFVPENKM